MFSLEDWEKTDKTMFWLKFDHIWKGDQKIKIEDRVVIEDKIWGFFQWNEE